MFLSSLGLATQAGLYQMFDSDQWLLVCANFSLKKMSLLGY